MLPDPAYAWEVSPENVATWVNLPPDLRPRLIDCREQDELAICQISGHEWFPLPIFSTVREKLLARNERGVVVYCHHGVRSLRAVHFLRSIGVENSFSMSGGIDAWATQVAPDMSHY